MDGLWDAADKIHWRSGGRAEKRFVIHIADAPPHGDLYTGTKTCIMKRSFVWNSGCPCGVTIEKIAH